MWVLADQQELIYNSSEWILDVDWKICCERGMIDGQREWERESGKSMLAAGLNDDSSEHKIWSALITLIYLLFINYEKQ